MLIDSHCHLDFPDFADELDDVVARAGEAGVGGMLTICTHVTRFDAVLAVAERYDNVWCSIGIHPHEAANEPEVTAEHLVRLARHPKVVGFGETGLDYHYEHSPREDQRRSFRVHIAAARQARLPLIAHSRNADDDTMAILREENAEGAFPGLIHCFTAGPAVAECAVELGLGVSISGIVTFKQADALRDVARRVPAHLLLVETDAPYLAPVPKRGKRNEPAFVAHTVACLAEARGEAAEALARTTTDNFFRLFAKAARPVHDGTNGPDGPNGITGGDACA
ncbi:MAG: TatD family hydrolase [Rhodospirillales bacterium]|jgi:TatD DNase family protein|nr:TatD family hydrolase [Rhodospirillales bacterium]HJO73380.1 TatD family hydrolase [Rhodospirillales bacterium]